MTRRVGLFLAICFSVSWAIVAAFVVTGAPWEGGSAAAIGVLVAFPPGISALAVKGAILGEPVREAFAFKLKPNRWFLWAWLTPVALLAMTVLIGGLLPGVSWTLSVDQYVDNFRGHATEEQIRELTETVRAGFLHPVIRDLFRAMLAGATLAAVLALIQEIAWRGFLHHELKFPFWPRSILIGLIWGVWRVPIAVLGRGDTSIPTTIACMLVWAMLASCVLCYIRERSGSVIACAICHGTMVATAGIAPLLTEGGDPALVGLHGLAGITALGAMVLAIALWERRRSAGTTAATAPTT